MTRWGWLGVLCAVAVPVSAVAAPAALPLYVHSLEGAVYPDGPLPRPRPGGGPRAFSLALALSLQARLGQLQPISVVPLARALMVLDRRQPAMLVGLFRTPAREQRYQWLVPLYQRPAGVLPGPAAPGGRQQLGAGP